jgi:TRAP-type mannitol/chloroaromatic compound transport system permease small subunit
MKVLRAVIRTVDKVSEVVGLAMSVLIPAMVAVLTFEVVARYVFKSPTMWAYDTSIFMFGYAGLLCGAYALKFNAHINVDVLYARLSPRRKALMDLISGLIVFFFVLLVIIYGTNEAVSSFIRNERRPTEWAPPVGHLKLMIPIGGILLLLQGLANWIRTFYRFVTGKEFEV